MSPALETLLARAYQLDQLQHDPATAIGELKKAMGDDAALRTEAKAEHARLAQVVAAREQGGRDGDHVSAVLAKILTGALAP